MINIKIQLNSSYGAFSNLTIKAKKFYIGNDMTIAGVPWTIIRTHLTIVAESVEQFPTDRWSRIRQSDEFMYHYKIRNDVLSFLSLKFL